MTDSRKWLSFALILVLGGLIFLLSSVLAPFFIAAIVAYMFSPLVDYLEKLRCPRVLAVSLIFLFFILIISLLISLLIPALEKQVIALINLIPVMLHWLEAEGLPWLAHYFGVHSLAEVKQAMGKHSSAIFGQASDILSGVINTILSSGESLIAFVVSLVLVPVICFYLMRDWTKIINRIREHIPRKIEPIVSRLASECNEVLGAFFRGQLLVMLGLGIIYSLGLWLVGLKLALIIGLIAGLVSIVPYLGFIIGILAATIASIMQFHGFGNLWLVLIVFAVGQALESMVFTPLFVGGKIGLHPVAVIFAILVGGTLFGFAGVLLALPAAAVIMVLLRFARRSYIDSELYHSKKVKPIRCN